VRAPQIKTREKQKNEREDFVNPNIKKTLDDQFIIFYSE
jgi:hypothetical protein